MVRFYTGGAATPRSVRVDDGAKAVEGITDLNVKAMREAENSPAQHPTFSDRIADLITRLSGSMLFVWLHIAWFAIWIVLNVVLPQPFDGFPFGFLTMVVSLEAIFLSTFVLISQNRQALLADRRSQLDMQVNLLAEQEVTKLMAMVADIHERLGMEGHADPEVREMAQPTELGDVARSLDASDDPSSAAQ